MRLISIEKENGEKKCFGHTEKNRKKNIRLGWLHMRLSCEIFLFLNFLKYFYIVSIYHKFHSTISRFISNSGWNIEIFWFSMCKEKVIENDPFWKGIMFFIPLHPNCTYFLELISFEAKFQQFTFYKARINSNNGRYYRKKYEYTLLSTISPPYTPPPLILSTFHRRLRPLGSQ